MILSVVPQSPSLLLRLRRPEEAVQVLLLLVCP